MGFCLSICIHSCKNVEHSHKKCYNEVHSYKNVMESFHVIRPNLPAWPVERLTWNDSTLFTKRKLHSMLKNNWSGLVIQEHQGKWRD